MSKAMKSLFRGMGYSINICPRPAPSRIRTRISKSDRDAIRGDWEHVGDAIWRAAEKIPGPKVGGAFVRGCSAFPRNIKEGRVIRFRSKHLAGSTGEKNEVRTGKIHLFRKERICQITEVKPGGPVKSEVRVIGRVIVNDQKDS